MRRHVSDGHTGLSLVTLSLTVNETLKLLSSLPISMQKSFWWWQCSDRYIIFPLPPSPYPLSPFSLSLISLMVSVDVKHHVYLLTPALNTRMPLCVEANQGQRFSLQDLWPFLAGASRDTPSLTLASPWPFSDAEQRRQKPYGLLGTESLAPLPCSRSLLQVFGGGGGGGTSHSCRIWLEGRARFKSLRYFIRCRNWRKLVLFGNEPDRWHKSCNERGRWWGGSRRHESKLCTSNQLPSPCRPLLNLGTGVDGSVRACVCTCVFVCHCVCSRACLYVYVCVRAHSRPFRDNNHSRLCCKCWWPKMSFKRPRNFLPSPWILSRNILIITYYKHYYLAPPATCLLNPRTVTMIGCWRVGEEQGR